ncbi:hypothetical protein EDD85DRAFT_1025345 [Armillaria nabsnona]|nr:hypothetical protein EDD85DRAFT_1025345 [Armillaria nabsnona]
MRALTKLLGVRSLYVPLSTSCRTVHLVIQLADAPAASTLPFSSKAPPLPKELAEDLLNENKNKLVRAAIAASRADPALANAREIAFTEALSKADARRTSHYK